MNNYDYVFSEYHVAPPTYSFAKCDHEKFYDEWFNSRNQFAEKLEHLKPTEKQKEVSQQNGEYISLEIFLVALSKQDDIQTSMDFQKFEKIRKKFEVFKRLFNNYKFDFSRKEPNSELASLSTYIIFAQILEKLVIQSNELGYYSTFLKLMDFFCSWNQIECNKTEITQLKSLLNFEKEFTNKLLLQVTHD